MSHKRSCFRGFGRLFFSLLLILFASGVANPRLLGAQDAPTELPVGQSGSTQSLELPERAAEALKEEMQKDKAAGKEVVEEEKGRGEEEVAEEEKGRGEEKVRGEREDAEQLSDSDRFIQALDDLEEEILERERKGKYGRPEIEDYAASLEEEYLRNRGEMLSRGALDTRMPQSLSTKLADRQQHLAMLLWQVERVGAQLAKPQDNGSRMSTKIHALLSQHKAVMKDVKLMRRFQDLSRRASELSRLSYTSTLTNNFHFVRPQEKRVGGIQENKAIPAGNGVNPGQRDGADPNPVGRGGLAEGIRFPDGPLQKVRVPIGNLIRFRWDDGKLVWDKDHWKTPFAGQTLESIDEQVREELTRRGVTLPEEDRMVAFRKKRLFETPDSMLLFQDFQFVASAGKTARTSFSSSGKVSNSRFTAGQIEASFMMAPEKSEVMLREESGPGRTLTLRVNKDGSMRLSLIGDHILLLEQAADGSCRWVDIGKEVTAIRATSIADLYREYPERFERELLARLSHNGIILPMTRYEEGVVRRVLDQINGVDEATRAKFAELMKNVDGGSFSKRQKAYRELQDDLSRYSILISQVAPDEIESTEVVSRLAKLTARYNAQYQEVDGLIKKTDWLSDPTYLLGLAKRVDSADLAKVTGRLAGVTGQDFGNDLEKWSQWIADQN